MNMFRMTAACVLFVSIASAQQPQKPAPPSGRYQLITAQIEVPPQAATTASGATSPAITPFVPSGLTEAGYELWRNAQTAFREQMYEARAKAQALADSKGVALSQLTRAEWDEIYGLKSSSTSVHVVFLLDTETGEMWRYQALGDVLVPIVRVDLPKTPASAQQTTPSR